MPKMTMEFAGFREVMKKLEGLNANTKKITEDALTKTHDIVTRAAEAAAASPNLPAGGKYSTGDTIGSLRREATVEWNGTEASVPVGFDIKRGGLASIFLMYGTPRMPKVQGLYDAFYGAQTEGEVLTAQKKIFYDAVDKAMEGGG